MADTDAAIASLKADIKAEIAGLKADNASVKAEIKADNADVKAHYHGIRTDIADRETRLAWRLFAVAAAAVALILGLMRFFIA